MPNQESPDLNLDLNLRGDQRFSCTSCGKCCRENWNVPVLPEVAESLKRTKAYKVRQRSGFQPLPVVEGGHRLGRHENGECVFFEDDGCDIHRELGISAKPTACQLYPFYFIGTPDGHFVSLDFSCPAVLSGMGSSLSQQREELEKLLVRKLERYPQTNPIHEGVLVAEDCRIGWEEYLQLERGLLGSIRLDTPVSSLLNSACLIVERLQEQATSHPTEVDFSRKSALFNESLALHPVFSEGSAAIIEVNFSSESNFSGLLGIPLPPFQYREPTDLITAQIISRYIENLILGKRMLTGPTLVTRLLQTATALSILLLYVEAQTQDRGNLHFSFDLLDTAFELIEVNFATHRGELGDMIIEYERALWKLSGESTKERLASPLDESLVWEPLGSEFEF